MMKMMTTKQIKYLFLLLLFVVSTNIVAQKYTVQGIVTDTTGQPMTGAIVVLMTQKDSLLKYFSSADNSGKYELNNIKKGKYILQASFTSYKKYEKNLDLQDANTMIVMDTIVLVELPIEIETIEISGEKIPVRYVNDTLIYDAASFKTDKNAVVEDLLKKMPGIEVDDNGEIKAQGKKVKKVTVDGKEFFGNDPKIATKNLPSEAVKKVKVFDKKSDYTELTGIDDGNEEKTIDLELKKDHKTGTFGKISAGYGTEEKYQFKTNLNSFSPKTKLSFISKINNTKKSGFNFRELIAMNGGISNMMDENNNINFSFNGDLLGTSEGINKFNNTGANLVYMPLKNMDVILSYYIVKSDNFTLKNTIQKNYLQNNIFDKYSYNDKTKNSFAHYINATIKYKINKSSKIRWKFFFNNNVTESNSIDSSYTFNSKEFLTNDLFGETNSKIRLNTVNSYITYSTKFKKKGRSLLTKFSIKSSDNISDYLYNSLATYYLVNNTKLILQTHNNYTNDFNHNYKIAYTEPLIKHTYLVLDYFQNNNTNTYNKYIKNSITGYNKDLYESNFNNYGFTSSVKYNGDKHQISVGLKYQKSTLFGDYISGNKEISKNYTDFLPNINYTYKIKRSTNLHLRFNSNLNAPTIYQLMPIVDNSNPLYVVKGNKDLEPEKKHSINISFSSFNMFDGSYGYAYISGSIVQNSIVYSKNIDENFKTVSQPINFGNSENINFSISHDKTLPFLFKSSINLSLFTMYKHGYTLINNTKNENKTYTYNITSKLSNYKNKYFTGNIGVTYSITNNKYSINENQNKKYENIEYSTELKWKISKNLIFKNSLKYQIFDNNFSDNSNTQLLWDSYIKLYFKDKRYAVKLAAVDILNQYKNYDQYGNDNFLEYSTTNSIGRYLILSMTYSLRKF